MCDNVEDESVVLVGHLHVVLPEEQFLELGVKGLQSLLLGGDLRKIRDLAEVLGH